MSARRGEGGGVSPPLVTFSSPVQVRTASHCPRTRRTPRPDGVRVPRLLARMSSVRRDSRGRGRCLTRGVTKKRQECGRVDMLLTCSRSRLQARRRCRVTERLAEAEDRAPGAAPSWPPPLPRAFFSRCVPPAVVVVVGGFFFFFFFFAHRMRNTRLLMLRRRTELSAHAESTTRTTTAARPYRMTKRKRQEVGHSRRAR